MRAISELKAGLKLRAAEPQDGSSEKEQLRQLHQLDRSPVLKDVLDGISFLLFAALAVWLWYSDWWMLTPFAWIAAGFIGLAKPMSLHDAAHETLHPNRRINEVMGIAFGTMTLVPISVYRFAHAQHHAYLSSERDPELWPFVLPSAPRSLRLLAAFAEIVFGFVYTPLLFARSVLTAEEIPERFRRRIVWEYALIGLVWSVLLAVVVYTNVWEPILIGLGVPAVIIGMLQTLNKYTEHLGLTGNSILANTRTVAADKPLGRWLSFEMQHVDHHGTHHRYARIPYYRLPQATPIVYGDEEAHPVYWNYFSAFWDMLKTLPDPKAGGQWNRD